MLAADILSFIVRIDFTKLFWVFAASSQKPYIRVSTSENPLVLFFYKHRSLSEATGIERYSDAHGNKGGSKYDTIREAVCKFKRVVQ